MRQAVMTQPGKIEIRQVDLPRPGPMEALIRVRKIGVCGSDIHVYHGLHPYTSYPVVQGHEVSGEIEELGSAVTGFVKGQKVTFMPQLVCGTCFACRTGAYHICDSLRVLGFQAPGAAQERFVVSSHMLIPLPEGMSLEVGAMIEPLAVACHALRRGGSVMGKKVAVVGAGPIGNLIAQAAKALGAAATLISDVSDFRLDLARGCGVDYTVNASSQNLAEAIRLHFGADAADLILDCVGAESATSQAVSAARKGSTIVIVGVFGKKPAVDLGLVQDRELTLVGTLMYQREDYEQAISLAASGLMKLEKLITNRFDFDDYKRAYEFIEEAGDRSMKILISLDGEK